VCPALPEASMTLSPELLTHLRQTVKADLQKQLAALEINAERYCHGLRQVEPLLRAHRQVIDKTLKFLWKSLGMPASWTLVAVGGYGRGELFPKSDVDVMVLTDDQVDADARERLETFFGMGWDIGLELGHSVRTLAECISEAEKDITVQTAILESRKVAGNASLFRTMTVEFSRELDVKRFFDAKVRELRQRHTKYQETPYSLEPNCKESPGGLRDLHVILWVCRAAGIGQTWAEIAKNGLISAVEAKQLHRNERILKAIRLHLHWLVRRREDRLVFDVQTSLAERLGFKPKGGRRSSEVMMQQYYWAARAVWQLNSILLQNIELYLWERADEAAAGIDESFVNRGGLLDITSESVLSDHPSEMLRAFLVMQQHPELKGMTARLTRALWNRRFSIDAKFRRDPKNRELFLTFLKQPRGLVHELRRMAQLSILGRYLPVYRKIIGQMQHDLFHVYTVDQHIMQVIRNLRRFTMQEHAHEYPFCSQLISNFDDIYLLYVAALYHDIAKGRGGDHSVLGSKEVRRFARDHKLSADDTDLVVFLVEHHLTFSNIAQKQDLSDPDVIARVAALVKTERRLTALYLLTVADIRGTSPKVWNAWKGKLLEDLYRLTLRALGGEAPTRRQQLLERQTESKRILRLYTLDDKAHEALWKTLDLPFFLRNDPGDVAWATRHLFWRVDSEQPIVKARFSPLGEGLQVLIYCKDQPDLFARICGYFDSHNLSILDARINTTKTGYALDSFLVSDASQQSFYRELIALLENELTLRLTNMQALPNPIKGRPSRQSKHFPIHPSVQLKADERGQYYLLNLTAVDRTGLLYAVASTLAVQKITVHAAKIMTLGERVEDTFLIAGPMLNSPKFQIALETELMSALGG